MLYEGQFSVARVRVRSEVKVRAKVGAEPQG